MSVFCSVATHWSIRWVLVSSTLQESFPFCSCNCSTFRWVLIGENPQKMSKLIDREPANCRSSIFVRKRVKIRSFQIGNQTTDQLLISLGWLFYGKRKRSEFQLSIWWNLSQSLSGKSIELFILDCTEVRSELRPESTRDVWAFTRCIYTRNLVRIHKHSVYININNFSYSY